MFLARTLLLSMFRILRVSLQHENSVLSALIEADSDAFSRVFLFAAAQPHGMGAMDERVTLLLPEENPENAISCLREKLAYLMV